MRKIGAIIFFQLMLLPLFSQGNNFEVALKGNAYVTSERKGAEITHNGLQNWTGDKTEVKTFVFFHQPGKINLTIKGKSDNASTILVTINGNKKSVEIQKGLVNQLVGSFYIDKAGYNSILLQGASKEGRIFAEIESLLIQTDGELTFVSDFSEYWGRRGPSVHLRYPMPEDKKIEWFYNEVTVPEGNDVIGSYYMANGFGQGYFGIQCNSEQERRVLFSVWSPYDTQDPKLIPDSLKIKMLRRGEGVHIGEFGNEGSGGQSYLKYNWNTGNKYKFLTQIKPDGAGNTIYTAYFFAADENRWRLIASFLRPETDTYYTGAHSFLENFSPAQGYITRKVYFSNQWFRTVNGEWIEADQVVFTYDETARKKARLDYQGGYVEKNNAFYLQNCGFFSESTPYNSEFSREKTVTAPVVDFDELEAL